MTHSGKALSSKSVEVAGSKSAEAAVSETRIRFVLVDLFEVYIVFLEHFGNIVRELEVIDACLEGASHKELH